MRDDVLHNMCITTQRHSKVLSGTHDTPFPQLNALTCAFVSPLLGEDRGVDSLSAH